ncbi:HTH domain-containing protein [Enterococcus avium]
MAERFEVSARTIYRDIDAFECCRHPSLCSPRKRWRNLYSRELCPK